MELTPSQNYSVAHVYVEVMRFKKDMTHQQIIRARLALEAKDLDGLKVIKTEIETAGS